MHKSLERLAELLPPPGLGVSEPVDWASVTLALGAHLPSDYREFIDTYGSGVIDGQLEIAPPTAGIYAPDVLTISDITPRITSTRWLAATKSTYPVWPAPGALLCWGSLLSQGDTHGFLYWRTGDPNPDCWPVVIWRRTPEKFEEHPGGMADFLSRTLLESQRLPLVRRDVFGAPESRFLNQKDIARLEAEGRDPWEYLEELHARFDDFGNPL